MPARSAGLLAGLLAGAAVTHFARPEPYDALVPSALPGSARAWTQASGLVLWALKVSRSAGAN